MPIDNVLKNFTLHVDGKGYAGQIEEFTPPELALQTEEFRAGGMDAPIDLDMGMGKMEASFKLVSFDPDVLKLFGLTPSSTGKVAVTVRGALGNADGTYTPIAHVLRGTITKMSEGTWSAGQKASLEVTMSLSFYQHTLNQEVIHEIEPLGMKRIIAGEDQLAGMRDAFNTSPSRASS